MTSLNSKSLGIAFLICALAVPSAVLAGTWVVEVTPAFVGKGYTVTDHETGTIRTKGQRAARKIAKALNNAQSSQGVVNSGTGPCNDPKSGVVC